ncbi:MAG: hypothetical protein JJU36_11955 [Phycisphaeraceae bacterium]|nr:hypothetical protein [Phycisphaeraceae bacterium]
MTQRDEQPTKLQITAISVADAAKVLASAYGRRVTEDQVRAVAEAGGLLRGQADDTINLLEYVAFLVREVAHGRGTD